MAQWLRVHPATAEDPNLVLSTGIKRSQLLVTQLQDPTILASAGTAFTCTSPPQLKIIKIHPFLAGFLCIALTILELTL